MITGSFESTPKGDITKEVWKRLYHNAPYLLKTKGTERGIKALLACYGIPESILHVKEYGGPNADKSGYRTFKYPKMQKALEVKGINMQTPALINLLTQGDQTVEFTILPNPELAKNAILCDYVIDGPRPNIIWLQRHPVHLESARLAYTNTSLVTTYSD